LLGDFCVILGMKSLWVILPLLFNPVVHSQQVQPDYSRLNKIVYTYEDPTKKRIQSPEGGLQLKSDDKANIMRVWWSTKEQADAGVDWGDTLIAIGEFFEIKNGYDAMVAFQKMGEKGVKKVTLRLGSQGRRREKGRYTIDVPIFEKTYSKIFYQYDVLAVKGDTVKLAVIMDEITCVCKPDDEIELWKTGAERLFVSTIESSFLDGWAKDIDRFSLVDRMSIKRILDEKKMDMMGLTSNKGLSEFESLTGATHLLLITYTRFEISQHDEIYQKLIRISDGEILDIAISIAPINY